jgi:hypothetical protein
MVEGCECAIAKLAHVLRVVHTSFSKAFHDVSLAMLKEVANFHFFLHAAFVPITMMHWMSSYSSCPYEFNPQLICAA